MPRGKKSDQHQPTNGATAEQANEVIEAIEKEHDGLLDLKIEYMNNCKPFHTQIKTILDEAVKVYGMSKRAIKSKVKERDLLRKADAIRAKLDDEEVEAYDKLSEQLGPLGGAARERYHRGDPIGDFARAGA